MYKLSPSRRGVLEAWSKLHSLRRIYCFWIRIREDYCNSNSRHQLTSDNSTKEVMMFLKRLSSVKKS